MPNIDGGHYFLTTLFPIKDGEVVGRDGQYHSPAHILRETLSFLPVHNKNGVASPFSCNLRTHFVRIFVLDNVIYNGRQPKCGIPGDGLLDFETIDELKSPYLVFVVDLDVPDETEAELDSYLKELWRESQTELKKIFCYCYKFDAVQHEDDFCRFIRKGQVETTMPFQDYFVEFPKIKDFLPLKWLKPAALVILSLWFAGSYYAAHILLKSAWGWNLLIGSVSLVIFLGILLGILYRLMLARGRKSFPIAPNSTLPSILKAIYLNKQFTQFAISQQGNDADRLYQAFADFIKTHQPDNLISPTQQAGETSQKDEMI